MQASRRLESTVAQFVSAHRLLSHGGRYLVALSGGADSVALLLAMHALHYDVECVHCNFHLRGEESDRDEHFCADLCRRLGVEFHLVHFDTRAYADLHKVSIEMAARELRYRYFEQLRRDLHADDICVAHHRDDQLETVLINLLRGTGIHGLTGMAPRRDHIVRPLLCVGRTDIEAYLAELGQPYVTDSTNLVDDVVRNKLRLDIIPLLRQINPSVAQSVTKTALRLAEAERVVDHVLAKGADEVMTDCNIIDHSPSADAPHSKSFRIHLGKLRSQPSPEMLLFSMLQPLGFTPSQIEQIHASLDAPTGKEWHSASHQALLDRGTLLVEPSLPTLPRPLRIPEEGVYVCGENQRLRVSVKACDDDFHVLKSKDAACLDAEMVRFPLQMRVAEPGDRFVPFGMKGTKLVSDYLTDHKFSLFAKRRQRVVVDAEGRIVWLVGERPDNRFRILPDTRQCLLLRMENNEY